MKDGNLWEVPVGVDGDFDITIEDTTGTAIVYTGDETLSVHCWHGDDLANTSGIVTAAWVDAPNGKARCTVNASATSGLTPDFYLVRLLVTTSTKTYAAYEGWLRLGDAPGSADAPSVYCSLQDILDVGGEWVTHLMVSSARTSFLADRARARTDIHKVILARARPQIAIQYASLLTVYGSVYTGAELPDNYIQSLITAGSLLVTDEIKLAAIYRTLHYICERQLTWQTDDPYMSRSVYYLRKYRQAIFSAVAQFDTDDDGVADFGISLGRFSFR